jgi:hypothetical protein
MSIANRAGQDESSTLSSVTGLRNPPQPGRRRIAPPRRESRMVEVEPENGDNLVVCAQINGKSFVLAFAML